MNIDDQLGHEAAMRRLDRDHGIAQLVIARIKAFTSLGKCFMYLCFGIAAVTYANTAAARDLAYMPNQAGGEIVLTDVPSAVCTAPARVAYSRGEAGDLIAGCWYAMENYVHIKWHGGSTRVFRYSQFTAFDQPAVRVPDMRL